jgi:hypothetical protein
VSESIVLIKTQPGLTLDANTFRISATVTGPGKQQAGWQKSLMQEDYGIVDGCRQEQQQPVILSQWTIQIREYISHPGGWPHLQKLMMHEAATGEEIRLPNDITW